MTLEYCLEPLGGLGMERLSIEMKKLGLRMQL